MLHHQDLFGKRCQSWVSSVEKPHRARLVWPLPRLTSPHPFPRRPLPWTITPVILIYTSQLLTTRCPSLTNIPRAGDHILMGGCTFLSALLADLSANRRGIIFCLYWHRKLGGKTLPINWKSCLRWIPIFIPRCLGWVESSFWNVCSKRTHYTFSVRGSWLSLKVWSECYQ